MDRGHCRFKSNQLLELILILKKKWFTAGTPEMKTCSATISPKSWKSTFYGILNGSPGQEEESGIIP
jgi:hypothetical protein